MVKNFFETIQENIRSLKKIKRSVLKTNPQAFNNAVEIIKLDISKVKAHKGRTKLKHQLSDQIKTLEDNLLLEDYHVLGNNADIQTALKRIRDGQK